MAEFLELVETIRAEEATAKTAFAGEGVRITSKNSPEYKHKLVEAVNLVNDVIKGKPLATFKFQEAMSTSDFPILFGDVIDRQMLASYAETPTTYSSWAHVAEVPDFRIVERIRSGGGNGILKKVPELGEYQAVMRSEDRERYNVEKYGAIFPISYEAVIDDALGVLRDQPERFGVAARRTEERFATEMLVDTNFFSSENKNLYAQPLTLEGVSTVLDAMSQMVDETGSPILNEQPAVLIVPPSLQIQAQNLLNATEFIRNTGDEKLRVQNWLSGQLTLAVNPWLPIVDTTNGAKSWYIAAAPRADRAAAEIGFLRGHAAPELFMKSPNAVAISGATVSPLDGDFDHDAVIYKVRHVLGGTMLDAKLIARSIVTGR